MTLEGQSCRWTATEENQDGAVTGAQWVEVELVDTCRWTGNPCMFGPTGCAAGGGLAVIRNEYFANGE